MFPTNYHRIGVAIKYVLFFCTMWSFLLLFITVHSSNQGLSTGGAIHDTLSQAHNLNPYKQQLHGDSRLSASAIAGRLLIGSTAPICTYNECRGCKTKCKAEQVPVDANDPSNSAYHYRCVCHK